MTKAYKIWWSFLAASFVICLFHFAYAAFQYNALEVICIEHSYYLKLLALAAIGSISLTRGKYLLCLLVIFWMSDINHLPELSEALDLQYCFEDNICQSLIDDEIIKIENDKIIYIPKEERMHKKRPEF